MEKLTNNVKLMFKMNTIIIKAVKTEINQEIKMKRLLRDNMFQQLKIEIQHMLKLLILNKLHQKLPP